MEEMIKNKQHSVLVHGPKGGKGDKDGKGGKGAFHPLSRNHFTIIINNIK